jgi:hypothetical protein
MLARPLFEIHQVIESQYTSEFANPKGWLKDTLVLNFDWVGQKMICFIIYMLFNYCRHQPTRIFFEWIVDSLGQSTEILQDTTTTTIPKAKAFLK